MILGTLNLKCVAVAALVLLAGCGHGTALVVPSSAVDVWVLTEGGRIVAKQRGEDFSVDEFRSKHGLGFVLHEDGVRKLMTEEKELRDALLDCSQKLEAYAND